jgi:hypothetical protein
VTTKHKWLPNEPTQKMLDAGCDLRYCYPLELDANILIDIYKAMFQTAPSVDQEPFGYLSRKTKGVEGYEFTGCTGEIPLYTHSQPPTVKQEHEIGTQQATVEKKPIPIKIDDNMNNDLTLENKIDSILADLKLISIGVQFSLCHSNGEVKRNDIKQELVKIENLVKKIEKMKSEENAHTSGEW